MVNDLHVILLSVWLPHLFGDTFNISPGKSIYYNDFNAFFFVANCPFYLPIIMHYPNPIISKIPPYLGAGQQVADITLSNLELSAWNIAGPAFLIGYLARINGKQKLK